MKYTGQWEVTIKGKEELRYILERIQDHEFGLAKVKIEGYKQPEIEKKTYAEACELYDLLFADEH